MNTVTQASEIRKVLEEIEPSHIAVAYVGVGWRKFVPTKNLKEIVVSPTFGSSPRAIRELITLIGIGNVHFLDNLHAKIYIGKDRTLLGSCNLSDNGLGDKRLREAAVVISDATQRSKLRTAFKKYVEAARDQYRTEKSKWQQLAKLQALVDAAEWNGIPTNEGGVPSLAAFDGTTDRIHIAWYQPYQPEYNKKAIVAVVPESKGTDPDNFFSDLMLFLEGDRIKVGDWILSWHCNDNGLPRKNGAVDWMRVQHVVPSGVKRNDYTKIAAQSAQLHPGTPPFSLSPKVKIRIRAALAEKQFAKLREPTKGTWRLSEAAPLVPAFLKYLQDGGPG